MFEAITQKHLPLPDLDRGNYVNLADPEKQILWGHFALDVIDWIERSKVVLRDRARNTRAITRKPTSSLCLNGQGEDALTRLHPFRGKGQVNLCKG
jgi:hypothetical protein